MARKTRFRLRYVFWLDMLDAEEQALADKIETLKTQRTFARTVRDGIRLIVDLRAGKVDTLFELFPWVKAEFLAGIMSKSQNDPTGNDQLRRELEQIKALLLYNTTPPTVAAPRSGPVKILQSGTTGPRALDVPKFDLPRFDDDDGDTLILTKDTSTDSAFNFLNSVMALQQ